MENKAWDGRAIALSLRSTHPRFPEGVIDIQMGARTAQKLALSMHRLRQTTIMLPPEVQELVDALDYVLVGDPQSRAAHGRMEAGKGMEPSGG